MDAQRSPRGGSLLVGALLTAAAGAFIAAVPVARCPTLDLPVLGSSRSAASHEGDKLKCPVCPGNGRVPLLRRWTFREEDLLSP